MFLLGHGNAKKVKDTYILIIYLYSYLSIHPSFYRIFQQHAGAACCATMNGEGPRFTSSLTGGPPEFARELSRKSARCFTRLRFDRNAASSCFAILAVGGLAG